MLMQMIYFKFKQSMLSQPCLLHVLRKKEKYVDPEIEDYPVSSNCVAHMYTQNFITYIGFFE